MAEIKAPAVHAKTSGARVYTVCLKSPAGVILRIFRKVSVREAIMGGGYRDVDIWEPTGAQYTLHGYATLPGVLPKVPVIYSASYSGVGYAINKGVPAEIWEPWWEQNKDHLELCKSGMIYGHVETESAEAHAVDGEKVVSGLEPLLQDRMDRDGKLLERDYRSPGLPRDEETAGRRTQAA